jgi:hypothetical protein
VRSSSPSSLPDTSALRSQSGPARRTDVEPRHGQGYCVQTRAGPGNDINAGSPGFQGSNAASCRSIADAAIIGHNNFAIERGVRMPAPPIQRRDTGARCAARTATSCHSARMSRGRFTSAPRIAAVPTSCEEPPSAH